MAPHRNLNKCDVTFSGSHLYRFNPCSRDTLQVKLNELLFTLKLLTPKKKTESCNNLDLTKVQRFSIISENIFDVITLLSCCQPVVSIHLPFPMNTITHCNLGQLNPDILMKCI